MESTDALTEESLFEPGTDDAPDARLSEWLVDEANLCSTGYDVAESQSGIRNLVWQAGQTPRFPARSFLMFSGFAQEWQAKRIPTDEPLEVDRYASHKYSMPMNHNPSPADANPNGRLPTRH